MSLPHRLAVLLTLASFAALPVAGCGGENEPGSANSGGGGLEPGSGGEPVGGLPTGGTATGGQSNLGGLTSSGGGPTGGVATGGMASGGAATGGMATGGAASGGFTTGGIGTGGLATGGIGTGGMATGGTATGGTATGGTATGGTETGGAPTGGAGTGGEANGPITIWIAGDSTVANGSTPCPAGWGKHFQEYFGSQATVVNRAVGGRSVQTWLYDANVSSTMGSNGECVLSSNDYNERWTTMLDGMQEGDYLFIQFGINDGDSSCPRHVGSALYVEYLGYMADAAKERAATPIFLTPTAAIQCSGSTAVGNRGFLTETRSAATDNDVTLIDLNQLSVELYNSEGLCPNNDTYTGNDAVGQFFCEDHTHFEDAGAIKIAGAVAQAVEDQGLPLAGYLAN